VKTAVADFELRTFDGVKQGLNEVGIMVKQIPHMVSDCANVKSDISILTKLASIFEHPLSLIYHVGKSIIVNGADIF
jgi:hypothetical protein